MPGRASCTSAPSTIWRCSSRSRLFTALGLVELFSRHRAVGGAALAILVVATGVGLSPKVRPNHEITEAFEQRAATLAALQVDRGVVFLEGRVDNGWNGLAPFLQNTPDIDGRYVVAQDNGTGNFDVLDRFPDRTPILFQTVFDPGEPFLVRYDAQRMSVDQGSRDERDDRDHRPRGRSSRGRVRCGSRMVASMSNSSPNHRRPGFRQTVSWRLTARGQEGDNIVPLTEDGSVELGVTLDADDDKGSNSEHKLVYSYRVRDQAVQVLRPARIWQRTTEQPFWYHDVSGTMVDRTPPRS